MVFLVLGGAQANASAVAEQAPTCSPAAATDYPTSSLYDGRTSSFWAFGSLLADSYVRQDLNRVRNGGFETFASGAFTSWTSDTATSSAPAEETSIKLTGARSAKLQAGALIGSYSGMTQTLLFRAGEKVRGTVSVYAESGSSMQVVIADLSSGKSLNSSGQWVSGTNSVFATVTTAAWSTSAIAFQVRSRRQIGGNLATIRISVHNRRVGTSFVSTIGYVDEFRLWPETNLVVLSGHNVPAAMPAEVRSSTDNFAAVDVLEGTMVPRPRNQYAYLPTPCTSRYIQVQFATYVSPEAIRATELVIGYATAPAESPSWGFSVRRIFRQLRNNDRTLLLAAAPEDAIDLQFEPHTSEVEELEDFVELCLDGSLAVVIPSTTRDEVIVGRTPDVWQYQAASYARTTTGLTIEPTISPLWTP